MSATPRKVYNRTEGHVVTQLTVEDGMAEIHEAALDRMGDRVNVTATFRLSRTEHSIHYRDGRKVTLTLVNAPKAHKGGATAAQLATKALAAHGISAETDKDAGNSWLVVGESKDTGAHAVLCLHRGDDDETVVERTPDIFQDHWYAATVDPDGTELPLMVRPVGRLGDCVEAIAAWLAKGQPARSLPAELRDLHGRFADGYSADSIRSTFGRIEEAGGPFLVCVWDYADEYGFGGNSRFYAETENGDHFEVSPDIHQWLSGELKIPGPMTSWVCAPVAAPTDLPVSDDFHNYARTDRTS
ncbi:hypothetical protein AB0D00_26730 [Streptomyces sp. NPDC048213]|uniref:hypothetical protein n=1 Tax=Streptomyces sp. NPDC048213 TaxID=3160984 RepID=UPI0033EB429D